MRILALNDDNHSTCFMTEDRRYFNDACALITELLGPAHALEYEVRGFYICGDWELNKTEDEIDLMFGQVEGIYSATDGEFIEAFETLWSVSEERWF